jgi:hypothetical protein
LERAIAHLQNLVTVAVLYSHTGRTREAQFVQANKATGDRSFPSNE